MTGVVERDRNEQDAAALGRGKSKSLHAFLPVLLLGRDYWARLIDFDFLVDQGAIAESDLALFEIADSAEQAWKKIRTIRE